MGDLDGIVLATVPLYPRNPWQRIVYSQFEARGGRVRAIDDLESLEGAVTDRSIDLLHVNWLAPITQRAADSVDAWQRANRFLEAIDRARSSGTGLVWTVHNTLSHDGRFLLAEMELARGLARRADRVMVMNAATGEAVRPWYTLDPERIWHLPHPSYAGSLHAEGREEARRAIGIASDDLVAFMFGVIRPYKGIEDIMAVLPEAGVLEPRLHLLVAGERGPGADDALIRSLLDAPRVTARIEYLSDSESAMWAAASDVLLLPYRASLNSGVLLYAATMGRPVVAAPGGAAEEFRGADWVGFWSPGEPAGALVDEVRRLASAEHASASALAEAERRRPERIAAAFADGVAELVGRRPLNW